MNKNYVTLKDVCEKASSSIAQKDLLGHDGIFPIYGASGFIKNVDFYKQEKDYIAIVKDGAGIGRAMKLPAHSSVIGTMQYIIPKENVNISYLYYAICAMHLEKYFSGATIPHIYFKDYQKEKLYLPSLGEQEKIASIFEKLEWLIANKKKQLDNLGLLVQSRFIEMFGTENIDSCRWPSLPMEDIFSITSSRRILKSEWKTEGKIPFLRVRDMVQLANKEPLENEFYVSDDFYNSRQETDKVKAGDIVVSATSTIGKMYIIKEGERFYFKDADVLRFRKKKPVNSTFFAYGFIMPTVWNQVKRGLGGTTVSHLLISNACKLKQPLPPLELQNQFAKVAIQVDKSKLAIQKSLDELETLKKSLMQQYFG